MVKNWIFWSALLWVCTTGSLRAQDSIPALEPDTIPVDTMVIRDIQYPIRIVPQGGAAYGSPDIL